MPDLLEFIGDKSTSPQAIENLKAQVVFLQEKCDASLNQPEKAKFGEIQSPVFEIPEPKAKKEGLASTQPM